MQKKLPAKAINYLPRHDVHFWSIEMDRWTNFGRLTAKKKRKIIKTLA